MRLLLPDIALICKGFLHWVICYYFVDCLVLSILTSLRQKVASSVETREFPLSLSLSLNFLCSLWFSVPGSLCGTPFMKCLPMLTIPQIIGYYLLLP